MTNNENIKIFNDIEHHLELEAEHLEGAKLSDYIYMAELRSRKASSFKRKRGYKYNQMGKRYNLDQNKPNAKKYPRDKRAGKKKDKSNMKCYNCSWLGHIARECTDSQKLRPNSTLLNDVLVTSSVLLIDSLLMWIVDLRATDHIAHDRDAFVEYY